MIVVADTSPVNYLILIGEIETLPRLYEKVLIPEEVHRELQRPQTPPIVREWAAALPAWCEARRVCSTPDAGLSELDPGERDAILLALETGVNTLLIDEIEGRREAAKRLLRVAGTVAVLEKAAERGLTDFRAALARLDQTNSGFRGRFGMSF